MIDIPSQFQLDLRPIAAPGAVVQRSHVRFTVLTDRLIRMEYSLQDQFEDRASQVFWFRDLPVPSFSVSDNDSCLQIETSDLRLVYSLGQPFSPTSLSIEVKPAGAVWRYGDPDLDNLGGTLRTLDRTSGAVSLPPGLLSRQGFVLVDDTSSLVFNPDGWIAPRPNQPGYQDLYFFGCGADYQACLDDYMKVAGPAPLIPRWALGNWWSRYWAYTQEELTQLMLNFEAHAVPLSVCIIDMDWHLTQTNNACTGWTGYTWNRDLFPDPDAFIAFLHQKGLKTALNLHPAEGIHSHEAAYRQMAECFDIDPQSRQPVPFDLASPRFAEAYFRILHHPEEERGVDFWWLDWQQGELTNLPGLDPLWWLNHLHSLDRARGGLRRPFTFSRWGGLGNHRYPIGFSGDTHVAWSALAFQPYLTATAANVGYGWWSHDIGGHMMGIEDAELYTRWVQFGVFSPILRLHSTKNPYHERLPWGYDAETFRVTQHALQLRQALVPYLYSMAWRDHTSNKALVRPMYHLSPQHEEAYHCPNQYLFGSELIAAPFLSPAHPDTRLSRQVVWLPEGDWFDFFNSEHYPGQAWHAFHGGMDSIPVFARAGAIVPLGPITGARQAGSPERLEVHIFPGASNQFELYEDDGDSLAYAQGAYAITTLALDWQPTRLTFRIPPVEGESALIPPHRSYDLVFHAIHAPNQAVMTLNGVQTETALIPDPLTGAFRLAGLSLQPGDEFVLSLSRQEGPLLNPVDHRPAAVLRMLKAFRMPTQAKAVLAENLAEILKNPSSLGRYLAALSDAHIRALCEVLYGAGWDVHENTGKQQILLWNNAGSDACTYRLSAEQLYSWSSSTRFKSEGGAFPRFKVIYPDQAFSSSTWMLRLLYRGLAAYTIGSPGRLEGNGPPGMTAG